MRLPGVGIDVLKGSIRLKRAQDDGGERQKPIELLHLFESSPQFEGGGGTYS